jgi:dolichol-phosphate mannosyltransferase
MRCVVVAPTYQEAENVVAFLTAVRRAAPEADVLVIDDSSPDGTAELARAAAAELGQIEIMVRPAKSGLGSAYREGFAWALSRSYDVVVSMDVDFSHDPQVITRLLARIQSGADAVIGSRYVPGGATISWPLHRRVLSRWGNYYTAWILRLPIKDCTSGFRAYRASALAAIEPATTTAEGYAMLTEFAQRLVRQGATVVEEPIVFVDRQYGTSKMSARIIAESMLLVTRWGLGDRLGRRSLAR